jgi:glycosyltransferase involved in cell wall biosynthesis
MKILFIDSHECVYDTTTFLKRPLGGTQSAVSCLAKELAQAGHDVTVINGVLQPIDTDGVHFMSLPCPTPVLNSFDVIVPISGAMAQTLRGVGCTRSIVLWAHHASDQPSVQQLRDPAERDAHAGFAQVSQWQADSYATTFGTDPAKTKIMRNAVTPVFASSTPSQRWFETGRPPVLGYSSTPYRGLDVLLLSFAAIHAQLEGATLRVFSSMGIYGSNVPDPYSALYDLAHALPGVTYVGPLPQAELAQELAHVDIWAYPCIFPETSCISAMEAMASGNVLVSTALGALPETTAGFAHLADMGSEAIGIRATNFARHVAAVAHECQTDPNGTRARLTQQTAYAREHYNWKSRAGEWAAWLQKII